MLDGLETRRLRLRLATLADVDDLLELDGDPEVMRYITGGTQPSRRSIVDGLSGRGGWQWMARGRVDAALVGWFALDPSGAGEYELGYRLRRDRWGQGLATEGARALIAAAFGELGARRVWAQTMTVNRRSRRVMERCGLRYVRTIFDTWDQPIAGAELGDVEYELVRADWEAGPASVSPPPSPPAR